MGEQPIFTCKAHVFHIDPKTKRSWIPASSSAISVSFFYDSTRSLYRIISVEGTKAVINSTITPNMAFTKTSQKFGQWSDVRANTVYGLGFPSEAELNKFIDKFQEVKEATKSVGGGGNSTSKHTPAANGSTTPTPAAPAAGPGAGSVSATASPVCSRSAAEKDAAPAELLDANDDGDAVSPALLKSALASHQRSQSLSGLQPGLDSPKQQKADKIYAAAVVGSSATLPAGTHLPSGSLEAQLKYENDRLKLALAQSSANAKKWEVELATLKNNNARLTSALQESTSNVEEWKRQLQAYKEENSRLKAKLLDLESGKTSVDASTELKLELANLREKLELLETESRLKDDEINSLTSNNRDIQVSGDKTKALEEENSRLEAALQTLRNQLEAATDAHDSQRRILEALNNQLWGKIQELTNLHNEMHTALDT